MQPITDVTSNDVICNGGINPLLTPVSPAVVNVPAGATLTAEWHHGGSGADPSDASDPIDSSHKGPVITYLAKVTNASYTAMPSAVGLKWFKIQEDGLASDGKWGVDRMIANKGKVTFTIPKCIANGNYLVRHELIALHGAGSYPGAQLYVRPSSSHHWSFRLTQGRQMECAAINVSGGTGAKTPSTVAFPGAYKGRQCRYEIIYFS